jgi:translation initiation factor 4B
VIRDHEGKPKGFGYVEFETLDGLKDALARSGENFGGRNVRISVAEPRTSPFSLFLEFEVLTSLVAAKEGGRGGYSDEPSAADTATQWRRAGPLPARSSPAQGRPAGRYDSASGGGGGFGGGMDSPGGGDVDWSAARGTKFTPRPADSGFGGSQGGFQRGPPMREQREPPAALGSLDDVPSDWRGSRPARAPPAFEQRDSFRGGANGAPGRGFVERDVGLSGEAAQEESVSFVIYPVWLDRN